MAKILSIFTIFLSLNLIGQTDINPMAPKPTDILPVLSAEDSLYLSFLKEYEHIFQYDTLSGSARATSVELDALNIKNRLYALDQGTPLQLAYNERVLAFIKVYLERKAQQTEWMIGLSEQYFPMMEAALDRHELPLELKYLSVVESALNPGARSRAAAVGLWQFIYSTGRLYGLTINSYEDERKNPIKSTDAACRYLKDLYRMFDNWELALAAYNSGPGNVRKAIRRSGGKTNYWEIYPYLPAETRGYVPAFIAVNYAFNYYDVHGLQPKDTGMHHLSTDTLSFSRNASLAAISKWSHTPLDVLQNLNPSLRGDIVPSGDFALVLPAENALLFQDTRDSIYNDIKAPTSAPQEPDYITYVVRRGDFLGRIANRYGTTVSTLKRDNGLRSNNLNIGQRLRIINHRAQQTLAKAETVKKPEVEAKKEDPSQNLIAKKEKNNYQYYTIQPGDTLWGIASKLDGVTVSQLKQLNDVYNVKRLKPGQKLIIGKAG